MILILLRPAKPFYDTILKETGKNVPPWNKKESGGIHFPGFLEFLL
jgi:hypothetical protein